MPTPKKATQRLASRERQRRASKKVPINKIPPLIGRPGKWWREPLSPSQLQDAGPDEREVLIAQERVLRTEQLKERLRTLRQFSSAFDASKGYPLRTSELIRLPLAKLRKLNKAYESLRRAQSHPYVTFHAKTEKQKAAARRRAGEILPEQKVFLIHHSDARRARAEWKDGVIQITTTVTGGELYERMYLFERRPRSWQQVTTYTQALMRRDMKYGYYKILNSLYGPIGDLVESDRLLENLDQFFSTYNRWLAGTILGWVWMGTSVDVSRKKQRRQKTLAERFQERRKEARQREQDLLKRRLGMKTPQRRAKRRLVYFVTYRGSVVSRPLASRELALQMIRRSLAASFGRRQQRDYRIQRKIIRVRGDETQ